MRQTFVDLNQVLVKQAGVVTAAQARDCGLSDDQIFRLVNAGTWKRVTQGVFRSTAHSWSPEARLRAAVFGAGKGAVAYGPSAAWWHGLLEAAPLRNYVNIPPNRRLAHRTGVRLGGRKLSDTDTTTHRGLLVTGIPLTVLETSVVEGSVFMDQALQRRVTLPMLRAAHERNRGREGGAVAEHLLKVAESGGRSEAERKVHRILRKKGFVGWKPQYPAFGYFLDAAFEPERVAIEVDGWRFHRDAKRNSEDQRRQNRLVNGGWLVLRFDRHRLTNDEAGVVEDIRTALSLRRGA